VVSVSEDDARTRLLSESADGVAGRLAAVVAPGAGLDAVPWSRR